MRNGDRANIIGNVSHHCFAMGESVRILSSIKCTGNMHVYMVCSNLTLHDKWQVCETDLKQKETITANHKSPIKYNKYRND